ncbi:MAG TPA: hypothetical protein VJS44_10810 [Pyrinomonadaceae bacterium]|nr:hypothetical protein [Pyrinomonadaceae bacterium]
MSSISIMKSRTIKSGIFISSLFLVLFIQGCSDVETMVRNKAETEIDGHQVVIKPCRNSYTRTESDTPKDRQHVFGCGDRTKVEIRNDELTVNGRKYGTLAKGDAIEVKDEKVFINKKEAAVVAMK